MDAPRDDLVQALAKGQNPLLQAIMEVEAADNSLAALPPSAAAPMRCPRSKPTPRNQSSPSNVELEVHALLQNLDSKLDVGYVSDDSASKILATSQANEIEHSAPDPQSQSKTPRHQGTQRANAVSDLFCVLWVLLSFVVTLLMALLIRLGRVAILLLPPEACKRCGILRCCIDPHARLGNCGCAGIRFICAELLNPHLCTIFTGA